ncbi:MAG: sugar phosphate nucleotidyltransferase, partial [Acetobacteraceae bacterium]
MNLLAPSVDEAPAHAAALPVQASPAQTGIVPVILCGGAGTRLWPVSRESQPKPLWPLVSAHSLLHDTLARVAGPEFAPPIIVCNEAHRFLIAGELEAGGISGARILLEPEGRNTAPAIAAAALLVAETDPASVLWMMAADAAITDPGALRQVLA